MPSFGVATPPVAASEHRHPAVQNREPAKAQQQFVAARQLQTRPHGQVPDVDVRLEKRLNRTRPSAPASIERPGHVAERREERRELDRERNLELGA